MRPPLPSIPVANNFQMFPSPLGIILHPFLAGQLQKLPQNRVFIVFSESSKNQIGRREIFFKIKNPIPPKRKS